MNRDLSFVLNGAEVVVSVRPHERLLHVLRNTLHMPGTKGACGEGECGACTVIVDGRAVHACLYPAPEVEGRTVTTIEGLLEAGSRLSPLQESFATLGAIQCGFCTPGMIMAAKALLDANPDPTDEEIRDALVGNLCRCTGYVQILDAVRDAAARMRREAHV
jgi:aerobic-type carbon monoxide dehydrogenase small subunit (CoxS/CutS family)